MYGTHVSSESQNLRFPIISINVRELQSGGTTFWSICIKSCHNNITLENALPLHLLHSPFQLIHPKGRMKLERMTPKTSQNILFVFGHCSRPWGMALAPSLSVYDPSFSLAVGLQGQPNQRRNRRRNAASLVVHSQDWPVHTT